MITKKRVERTNSNDAIMSSDEMKYNSSMNLSKYDNKNEDIGNLDDLIMAKVH